MIRVNLRVVQGRWEEALELSNGWIASAPDFPPLAEYWTRVGVACR